MNTQRINLGNFGSGCWLKPALGLAVVGALALTGRAQTVKTWQAGAGDFFTPSHWSPAGAPGATEIGLINNGGTATLAASAGTHELGTIRLGDTQGAEVSGHVIMNGGTLILGNSSGDPKAVIGFSAQLSTFIMNGGTILFDGPDREDIAGSYNGKGVNELDWEVGEKGLGRFEMHQNAVMRIADDLKVAENAAGAGDALIDGNAILSAGSGISVSGGGGSREQTLVIAGNARVDAGNSMGAGDPRGHTDEGYLTMATGNSRSRLVIQDQGILNIRRLTAREGTSMIIVKDRGQFHIFDVLVGTGDSPVNRPAETGPNSTYASLAPSDATLILQDDALMTVNSDPASGPTKGLGISAQRDSGNAGGTARLIVRDRASLRIEQDLMVGTGRNPATSDGTLEVVGPNAKVFIGGNLDLAVDLDGVIAGADADGNPKAGKAALSVVLTGATHARVDVQGTARVAHGTLRIKTENYTVPAGAQYTVLKASGSPAFDGSFGKVDASGAAVPPGHTWAVEYTTDSVIIRVVPGPGRPDDNGLLATTETRYINVPSTINNDNTESLGVAIAANGNVIVGWEDDGDDLTDLESVWTMFDAAGASITPDTTIYSVADPSTTITSKFLSYFRKDQSAVPGKTSWGPKIKANLFGHGVGMGSTSFELGVEVPELAEIQMDAGGGGDIPTVQLLDNAGQPLGIVSGVSDADAEAPGDIRVADWDYLANGNVVIVGESRQRDELVDKYGGSTPGNHAIYRIVTPAGQEVKALGLVSEVPDPNNMWHGVGVTRDGFAVRFEYGGKATVRLFNNAGQPTSGNLDLADLAGDPTAGGGGRGDDTGFHGNGVDAYVFANAAGAQARLTVLNADGTLRYSTNVADDLVLKSVGTADAAIAPSGEVVAVFSATYEGGPVDENEKDIPIVFGRVFDAAGTPLGATFVVSDKDAPLMNPLATQGVRIARRGDAIAVAWESLNSGELVDSDEDGVPNPVNVVAFRLFQRPGAAVPINVSAITAAAQTVTITWSGGTPPYKVQRKSSLSDAIWSDVATTSDTFATVPKEGAAGFFRIQD